MGKTAEVNGGYGKLFKELNDKLENGTLDVSKYQKKGGCIITETRS